MDYVYKVVISGNSSLKKYLQRVYFDQALGLQWQTRQSHCSHEIHIQVKEDKEMNLKTNKQEKEQKLLSFIKELK